MAVYFDVRRSYVLRIIGILIIIALVGFLIWWFLKPQSFCKKGGCASSDTYLPVGGTSTMSTYHPGHSSSQSSDASQSSPIPPSATLAEIITTGLNDMQKYNTEPLKKLVFRLSGDGPMGLLTVFKPDCVVDYILYSERFGVFVNPTLDAATFRNMVRAPGHVNVIEYITGQHTARYTVTDY